MPDVLFRDHDHGPGLVHLAEKDADAREVVGQLAEGDLRVDADAQQTAVHGLARDIVPRDVSLGLRQDLVADELVVLDLGLRVDQDADRLLHGAFLGVFDRGIAGDVTRVALDAATPSAVTVFDSCALAASADAVTNTSIRETSLRKRTIIPPPEGFKIAELYQRPGYGQDLNPATCNPPAPAGGSRVVRALHSRVAWPVFAQRTHKHWHSS